jgi:hypothetical protein
MLNDTLNLIALARQTALAKGKQAQAEQLKPVEASLRHLVSEAHQAKEAPHSTLQSAPVSAPPSAPPSALLNQPDFQSLLKAVQTSKEPVARSQIQPREGLSFAIERNQMVMALAAGGMADVEIARQMGLTREEVRLVLSINQGRRPTIGPDPEVSK